MLQRKRWRGPSEVHAGSKYKHPTLTQRDSSCTLHVYIDLVAMVTCV